MTSHLVTKVTMDPSKGTHDPVLKFLQQSPQSYNHILGAWQPARIYGHFNVPDVTAIYDIFAEG